MNGKRFLKKISIAFLIFFIFGLLYTTFAAEDELANASGLNEDDMSFLNGLTQGIIGVILYIPKLTILFSAIMLRGVCTLLLSGGEGEWLSFSPDTILFNKVSLLDINFFDLTGDLSSPIGIIKQNIANWYNTCRIIASGALLAVLVYIGIRMAISTVGEDKAKYKKMFQHWLESFVLLQLLHYIMIFVIEVNNALVNMLKPAEEENAFESLFDGLSVQFFLPNITSIACALCYLGVVIITVIFFVMYLKRMLTIGFLTLIAPLITITYSIDKIADNKSQALDTWIKMFVYNILIQPFHCIIYLVFIPASFNLVNNVNSVAHGFLTLDSITGSILAIASMGFCLAAEEKIIKPIFGFDKAGKTMLGSLATGAMVAKYAMPALKGSRNIFRGAVKHGANIISGGRKWGSRIVNRVESGRPGRILKHASKKGDVLSSGMMGYIASGGDEKAALVAAVGEYRATNDLRKIENDVNDLIKDIRKLKSDGHGHGTEQDVQNDLNVQVRDANGNYTQAFLQNYNEDEQKRIETTQNLFNKIKARNRANNTEVADDSVIGELFREENWKHASPIV